MTQIDLWVQCKLDAAVLDTPNSTICVQACMHQHARAYGQYWHTAIEDGGDLLSLVGRVFFSAVSACFNLVLSKVVTSDTSGLSDMVGDR